MKLSPNSPNQISRDVYDAQSQGQQAMEKAAQCSGGVSDAAAKKGLQKMEVTSSHGNRLRVALQKLQQRAGRPLILHPQGAAELAQYPQTFSDLAPNINTWSRPGTYTRVPPGTQFARFDMNFDDLSSAMKHARDLQLVGGPGGTNSYQRTLYNHINNTTECIGNTGGGPRPLGGWVSTTLKENFDHLFSRFVLNARSDAQRYTVIYEGQTGRNTVGYVNDMVDMVDEAEVSIPNMVPAQDIQRVRIFDLRTGNFIEVPRP